MRCQFSRWVLFALLCASIPVSAAEKFVPNPFTHKLDITIAWAIKTAQ